MEEKSLAGKSEAIFLEKFASALKLDYQYWSKLSYWTLGEAIFLCMDIDPYRRENILEDVTVKGVEVFLDLPCFFEKSYDEINRHCKTIVDFCFKCRNRYNEIRTIAYRSFEAGGFKTKNIHRPYEKDSLCLIPSSFLSWVSEKDFKIPVEFSEIFKIEGKITPLGLPSMTREHTYYSEELEMAVAAWIALYQDGKIKTNRGHKDQIVGWLKEHYPEVSKGAIERVATVVNPNKKGGAPSIE
ncbi:MAG: hypothetical protein M0P57_14270 [Syntrophales bacterium]|jgi:hypothetical protein|nr:hypothetical protein [Syntrophales bacterium]